MSSKPQIPEAPYHPLSAIAIAVLDGLWSVPELTATVSIAGLPALPVLVASAAVSAAVAVGLVQKYVAKEETGSAVAKGVVAGILAGVPYPVAGTGAGLALLAWSGANKLLQPPTQPPTPPALPPAE